MSHSSTTWHFALPLHLAFSIWTGPSSFGRTPRSRPDRARAARDARHRLDSVDRPGAVGLSVQAEGLVEVRVAVPPEQAETAMRIIAEHREQVPAASSCRSSESRARLERRIGYRFRDIGLLEHALTHKSKAHEDATGGVVDNESLEFLGDAVLGFVIADLLYREFPQLPGRAEVEGQGRDRLDGRAGGAGRADRAGRSTCCSAAAKRRPAAAASRRCWPTAARRSSRRSIWTAASRPRATSCSASCADEIEHVRSPDFLCDYKSALQERLQSSAVRCPVLRRDGRTWARNTTSASTSPCGSGGDVLADSEGRTKKEAEQARRRTRTSQSTKYEPCTRSPAPSQISMMPAPALVDLDNARSLVARRAHQRGLRPAAAAPARSAAPRARPRLLGRLGPAVQAHPQTQQRVGEAVALLPRPTRSTSSSHDR